MRDRDRAEAATLVRVGVGRPIGGRRAAEDPAAATMPMVLTGPIAVEVVGEPRVAVPATIVARVVTVMTVDRVVTVTTVARARPEAATDVRVPLGVAGGRPAIVAALTGAALVGSVARAVDLLPSRAPRPRSAPLTFVRVPADVAPTSTNRARASRSRRTPGSTRGPYAMPRNLPPNAP